MGFLDMPLDFVVGGMPILSFCAVGILFVNSALAFIFTCQGNFSAAHDKGNEFFKRITRIGNWKPPKNSLSPDTPLSDAKVVGEPIKNEKEGDKEQNFRESEIANARSQLKSSRARECSTSSGEFIQSSARNSENTTNVVHRTIEQPESKTSPTDQPALKRSLSKILEGFDANNIRKMIQMIENYPTHEDYV